MGGIVINIWEKSNIFRSFGSQKGAKNFCFMVGLKNFFLTASATGVREGSSDRDWTANMRF